MSKVWESGGCHCGAVQFKVRDEFKKVTSCDCSIYTKKGFLHIIVSKDDFELLSDQSQLSSYQFYTRTANHLFCKTCGISSFYIPRSHPDGFSVNARCVEGLNISSMNVLNFEGSSWEENINQLK